MADLEDPDDIIREIDEEDEDDCDAELQRLRKKRRGFRAAFTEIENIITTLITATRGADGALDRSEAKRNALQRAQEKLETRYEKLQRLNNRMLTITLNQQDENIYRENIETATGRYTDCIARLGELALDLQPRQIGNVDEQAATNSLKPIQALKPSFILSFDNTPTELAAWGLQFRSYFDASKLNNLPVPQQQAFLRQGLNPDVWTAIKHKVNNETPVFRNPLDLEEDSCEKYVEEAFQIRYPLIMRRYKFFTYERRGNQTFTNFYAKLRELASAAQLEQMGQNDYLIFRVIAGINDSYTADKLLSIPQAEFTLEEINRVAVACEAAKNISGLHNKSQNISNNVNNKKKSYQSNRQIANPKLDSLAKQGKCFRCGRKMHSKGQKCPHKNSKCHICGIFGHIAPVFAKPTNSSNSRSQSRHNSRSNSPSRNRTHSITEKNVTHVTFNRTGPKPTPKQWMTFGNKFKTFGHKITPDSGSTRTIFAKDVLDKHKIPYKPNTSNETLFNASKKPMIVNGIVDLTAKFNGNSKHINGLVSEDLKDTILLSWYDAEDLGSLSITRNISEEKPSQKIENIKRKYSSILRDSLSDRPMDGPPMKIHFKKDAIAKGIHPKKVYTASLVPLHRQAEANKVLKAAIRDKLIEEVPINEPSEWCSRAFFVPKPNGSVRLVADLSLINNA